jgi:hypothetical protein
MNMRHLAVVTACLAAAVCGNWLARTDANTSHESTSAESINGSSGSAASTRENGKRARTENDSRTKERSPPQLAALKKEIMGSFANASSPRHDWALRARTAALLATLSDSELRDFISELTPAKDGQYSWEDWQSGLIEQIHQAWGLMDPAAAFGSSPNCGVFEDWLRRDPRAASDFFEKHRSSSEMDPLVKSMQRSLLNQQALSDLQGASRSLAGLDPQMRQSMLITWTRMFANDPAKRQELAALLASWPDAKVSEIGLKSLVSGFSERSPSEAAAFVETLAVSESLKDQLSHEVIGEWALKDPKQAFGAWIERGETEVPKPLMQAMDEWSLNFPGVTESIKWVNGLEPGPVKEQFKNHMVGYLADLERFPQAAQLSAGIADPTGRVRQLNLVKRIWEERYPKQANEWYSKLSPEDRSAMERPLE